MGVVLRRSGVPKHGMVLSCVMDFVNLCQEKKEKRRDSLSFKDWNTIGCIQLSFNCEDMVEIEVNATNYVPKILPLH